MITVRGLFAKTCAHCSGASGHPPIPDDGYLICYPCLLRAAREAQDARIVERARVEWEEEQTTERINARLDLPTEAARHHKKWHRAGEAWPDCSFCQPPEVAA